MSDMDPTRQNEVVGDTAMMPTPVAPDAGAPPPPYRGGGVGGGDRDQPNRNLWWIIGALVAIVIVLALILVLGNDNSSKTDLASGTTESTSTLVPTTTSSTTSTTAPTTTTQKATTSTAPKTTIPPSRCTGATSPAKPAVPATTFYDAWRVGDRACAEKLGTNDAVDTLFKLKPNGPGWDFQGCTEVADPEPHADCAFTYEGGAAHFNIVYGDLDGWSVYEVTLSAD